MNGKKIYVLDTNVILHNPHSLLSFQDNDIILPDVVIDELDKHKKDNGEIGANSRQAARMIDSWRTDEDKSKGDLLSGYKLPNGGTVRVEMNCINTQMPSTWKDTPDLRILRVCKGLYEKEKNNGTNNKIILVSNDGFVRIKASILGIEAQDYRTEKAPSKEDLYSGRREAFASSKVIDAFYKTGEINESDLKYYAEDGTLKDNDLIIPLTLHEYVLIKADDAMGKSALGIFNGNKIVPLKNENYNPHDIIPKNVGQKCIVDALSRPADEAPLVIIKGAAGTGKTLVALAVGLDEVVENKNYKRILYLRGNTKLDEDIGFLPGTEQEKLDWALRPVRDNLEVIYGAEKNAFDKLDSKKNRKKNAYGSDFDKDFLSDDDYIIRDKIAELFERGYINIEAVAHMRGRSIANTFVIIDEVQNLTPKQIKTLLSRCSTDTKIVLLGDPNQIDHPFLDYRTNGLCYAADRMAGSEITYQLSMLDSECERSELSMEISKRMTD